MATVFGQVQEGGVIVNVINDEEDDQWLMLIWQCHHLSFCFRETVTVTLWDDDNDDGGRDSVWLVFMYVFLLLLLLLLVKNMMVEMVGS